MAPRLRRFLGRAVRSRQRALLLHAGNPRQAIVGRVAQNDQNRCVALHALGGLALLLHFAEHELLGVLHWLPSGERVCEEYAGAFMPGFGQRCPERLQQQTQLEVRHRKRGGQDLEAEHALQRRRLEIMAGERIAAVLAQRVGDLAQHLDQVRARPTARVQNVHIRIGQPVLDAQRVAQLGIHARHHVLHHLDRRVPDTQVLAQFGIECLQERLVEVLYGVAFFEVSEERSAINAVQRRARPIEDLRQVHRLQLARFGDFVEELPQDRHAQIPRRHAPLEPALPVGGRVVLAPQHPSREDPVE